VRRWNSGILALCCLLLLALPAPAGMPSPLPTEPEYVVRKVLRLDDTPLKRLQAISFFLLVFVLSAVVVRWLWNYFQRDFPKLPRLSFGKALAGVFLWGLLFVVVLTMISGARELMTPGAWKKQGFTYRLADERDRPTQPSPQTLRRQHLEKLRTALWQFAATHKGRFPRSDELTALPGELWEVPESGGMRYLYVAGQSAGHAPTPLVYEPELDAEQRLVLLANGDILSKRSSDIQDARKGERP
jgi:hypothetical protein